MGGFDRVLYSLARAILRNITGHWPRPPELSGFQLGYQAPHDRLPPLLHAVACTERLRPLVIEMMIVATRTAAPTPAQAACHRPSAGAPIAFMHIEKTAGTSLAEFLQRRFSPMLIMPQPRDATAAATWFRHPSARAYPILQGHFDLQFLRTHAPDRQIVTFLREPVARLLSCYYYWRSGQIGNDVEDVNEAAVLAGRLGLLDFLRCDHPVVVTQIDNIYARRLTGDDRPAGIGVAERCSFAIVDRALAELDSLAFVGITERFSESLVALSAKFGWVPPRTIPCTNSLHQNEIDLPQYFKPVPPEPITPQIRAELDRLTRLDRVIYRAALRKFDAAV